MPLKPEFIEVFSEALGKVMSSDIGRVEADRPIADLGLDSMALVELVTLLEQQMNTSIEDHKLSELRTIGDLERLLEARSNNPG